MEGSIGWKQYLPYMYMYRMLSTAKTIQHCLLVTQFFYRTLCMEYGTISIGMQQVPILQILEPKIYLEDRDWV